MLSIADHRDIMRETLEQSAHSGILVPAFDSVTIAGKPQDEPSAELVNGLLFASQTVESVGTTQPLYIEAPEIVMHGIRQVALSRATMPSVILKSERSDDPFLPPWLTIDTLPLFDRIVVSADAALGSVPEVSRQLIWREGPKDHPEERADYQEHPALGWEIALSSGDMTDYSSRIIAMAIARHHVIQSNHGYGLDWENTDADLRAQGFAISTEEEHEMVDTFLIPQTLYDGTDDNLSRAVDTDVDLVQDRSELPLNKFQRGIGEFVAGQTGSVSGENDGNERTMLRVLTKSVRDQFSEPYGEPTAIHNLYQDTWDETRGSAAA